MLRTRQLGVIGAGNMGEALLRGVLHGGLINADRVLASARTEGRLRELRDRLHVRTTLDNAAVVDASDVVVLAVKPQVMPEVLGPLRGRFRANQIVLSVAAGITTGTIEEALGVSAAVLRAMPNTPALVGEGASAYCRGRWATAEHALVTQAILDSVGMAVEVDEALMDPVTAVSGTGPAYIFYTLEAMIGGAVALGIPDELARRLVKQTVLGAARLVMDAGEEPDQLRARVTSKGGTTEAAITHLGQNGYAALVQAAIGAACRRANELGARKEGA
ncbi:MAG: pyrroline-5-carboxylate reductase [Myxococcales bacterium]